MNNIYGNAPVSGDDFYGRNEFIKHLKGILLSKNSFLLLGLRRMGKSSSLAEVTRLIKQENPEVQIININCQTFESIQDFYKNIYLALPKTWRDDLRKVFKDTKRIPTKIIDAITDHIEEINIADLGSIKLRNDTLSYANTIKEELTQFFKTRENHLIVILDELPFLFENITENSQATKQEIEMILATLRSWRDIGISQAICGSLNLHIQLEHLGISRKLLGGINTQKLPKYTVEEAKGLLKELAKSDDKSFDEDQLNKIVELLPDHIPQFLQNFYFVLKTHWNGEVNEIKSIFDKHIYPVIVSDFEYQFNERFAKLSKDEIKNVKLIFNTIYDKPLITESDLINNIQDDNAYSLLLKLNNQEFIVIDEHQRYDFSFYIVKYWWSKKK